MRYLMVCLCLASPASAWEFTPGAVCLLTQDADALDVVLTHDPVQPLFTITLTRPTPWPEGDVFSIRFEGAAPFTISTNRHEITASGRALTVTDSGFTNVLNGLRFGGTAVATIGGAEARFSLAGAGGPTDAFALCAPQAGV